MAAEKTEKKSEKEEVKNAGENQVLVGQKPVMKYVETCIENPAKEAVTLMLLQGGYAQLPIEIANNPFATISPIASPIRVAFWYFAGENRKPTKNLRLCKCLWKHRCFSFTDNRRGFATLQILGF